MPVTVAAIQYRRIPTGCLQRNIGRADGSRQEHRFPVRELPGKTLHEPVVLDRKAAVAGATALEDIAEALVRVIPR